MGNFGEIPPERGPFCLWYHRIALPMLASLRSIRRTSGKMGLTPVLQYDYPQALNLCAPCALNILTAQKERAAPNGTALPKLCLPSESLGKSRSQYSQDQQWNDDVGRRRSCFCFLNNDWSFHDWCCHVASEGSGSSDGKCSSKCDFFHFSIL